MTTDQRLIEDYLPIAAISAEASREKSIRKGHICTLHLWWARRPLVACRAAVYGALVPAPATPRARKERSEFVAALCTYPGPDEEVATARRHILEAHAARLSEETGQTVTVADIQAGRAPRPRVLDMFAGGGAIPLEALRLGCEAHALDLNPVAHLIQLCTLVYPQQYGQPDPQAVGSEAGGEGKSGTWAGLAQEVQYWGRWVLKRVKAEIGDLYPPIPDPEAPQETPAPAVQPHFDAPGFDSPPSQTPSHTLTPIAYLWTRTVRCKNPACGATVPLARRTWLAKGKNYYAALKPELDHLSKRVRYRLVEATTEKDLDFNPSAGSRRGNTPCPFCGTVADRDYVKVEGQAGRISLQHMAVVCTKSSGRGKVYFDADQVSSIIWPNDNDIWSRIQRLEEETHDYNISPLTIPREPIEGKLSDQVPAYGMTEFRHLFLPRQLITLMTFIKHTRYAYQKMIEYDIESERAQAVLAYIAFAVDKLALRSNTLCTWATTSSGGRLNQAFGRQALEMVWDFAEANPFSNASGSFILALKDTAVHANILSALNRSAKAIRGSATNLPYEVQSFDAIITDPPYYDNIFYADLSDFFFVWLKRSLGFAFPAHFSTSLTPKKREIVASPWKNADKQEAKSFYEELMTSFLNEARRVLKPNAPLIVVYAHKTTAGWASLVDAMRLAGFMVTEAWPLDTELTGHRKADTAALASSIFLVARRREGDGSGAYETQVRPDLEAIVRERVDTLWSQGVSGADLVIAAVGAGLRAFTRYARVEYANGAEVPADTFLSEVEGVVLETLLAKLFGVPRAGVAGVDPLTRFYVLWRYTYRAAAIDAGEAIVFTYSQGVELDGPQGLTAGAHALVKKQRGKYHLHDFAARGQHENLGLPDEGGAPAPLIDVLHRALWLIEQHPALLGDFLDRALAGRAEQLRLVANTLAGPALAGEGSRLAATRGAEAAALRKLVSNWRTLVEANLFRQA